MTGPRQCLCPDPNYDCQHPTCPRYPQPGHLEAMLVGVRGLLERVLRESGAAIYAEPGGQPAWLAGGSIGVRLNPAEVALVEELLGKPRSAPSDR